jgi:hypothetical protein
LAPRSENHAMTLGSARPALSSLFSRSMISAGVLMAFAARNNTLKNFMISSQTKDIQTIST